MASIHQYVIDAEQFLDVIKETQIQAENEKSIKYKYVCRIQALYRGYKQRKHLQEINHKVIIAQKIIRSFLARKRLFRQYVCCVQIMFAEIYNSKAILIQKIWRGYYTRAHMFNYYKFKKWMIHINEVNEKMHKKINYLRVQTKMIEMDTLEHQSQQWVMFILFKLHHLLSTTVAKGIYKRDEKKPTLFAIEDLIRSLKYSTYMRQLRSEYSHLKKFDHKRKGLLRGRLARCEQYWCQRSDDIRTTDADRKCYDCPIPMHCYKHFYYRDDKFLLGPYEEPIRQIVRDFDASKNVSRDLYKSYSVKVKTFPNAIDYYVDLWDRLIFCPEHHIPNPYARCRHGIPNDDEIPFVFEPYCGHLKPPIQPICSDNRIE